MRTIDADALEKYLSDAEIEATRQRKYVFASALNTICGNIKNFPTIEPERKKGRWQEDPSGYGFWICSTCGFVSEASGADLLYKYCPNCGAELI